MDARDALRRYLDQQREAGEREIVLESMTRSELARLIAGRRTAPGSSTGVKPAAPSADRAEPSQGREKLTPTVREPAPTPLGEASSDWRAALRATGAEPDASVRQVAAQGRVPVQDAIPGGHDAAREHVTDRVAAAGDHPLTRGLHSLEDIVAAVTGCTRCPLYAAATRAVPGEGNPHADLMVVGEAPGATEDETGRPFVGAAGQLLTKILEAVGIPREQAYICNVLKHRPPGNRNPAPEEVVACSPYLLRQIELVRPKVILALGTFAAQTLLDTKTAIGKLRGQVHRYHGVPLVVTYHPAALLRNPAWKRPTWEDVQLARRILDNAAAADGS